MKSFLSTVALISTISVGFTLDNTAQAASISFGDVTSGGEFSGQTTRNDAWAMENPLNGNEMNFWTLSGKAGDRLSIEVTSLLNGQGNYFDAAISLYQGLVDDMDLLLGNFRNHADFGDVTFIKSTSPFGTTGYDAALLNILLPTTGNYIIAIGGEGFLNLDADYSYSMKVEHAMVPEPATLGLLAISLTGLVLLRRRQS